MTIQELFKKHIEENCKDCKIKNCKGITITLNNKTKCEKVEKKQCIDVKDVER